MRSWVAAFALCASILAIPFCPVMAAHPVAMNEGMGQEMALMEHVHASTPSCCIALPAHPDVQAISPDGVTIPVLHALLPVGVTVKTVSTTFHRSDHGSAYGTKEKFELRSKTKRE